jgi:CRISPR-associated protein Cas2
MILITYDITDNKLRTKFSKFINKYGRKVQYSVYEIKNSQRILQNIKNEIELRYKKKFKGSDSVLIFNISEPDSKKIIRYGYAKNEEMDVVVFD